MATGAAWGWQVVLAAEPWGLIRTLVVVVAAEGSLCWESVDDRDCLSQASKGTAARDWGDFFGADE